MKYSKFITAHFYLHDNILKKCVTQPALRYILGLKIQPIPVHLPHEPQCILSLSESFSLDQRTLLSPPMPPVREDEKFIDLDEVMDFASMETRLFDTPISCNASCGHTETRQSVAGAKELLMQLKKVNLEYLGTLSQIC